MLKYPKDQQRYYAVVNLAKSPSCRMLDAVLKPLQVAYFKGLLETLALQEVEEGEVAWLGSTAALMLDPCDFVDEEALRAEERQQAGTSTQAAATQGVQLQKLQLSATQKKATLDTLVRDGWLDTLEAVHDGIAEQYCIGVRSYLELKAHLLGLDLPAATRTRWEAFL